MSLHSYSRRRRYIDNTATQLFFIGCIVALFSCVIPIVIFLPGDDSFFFKDKCFIPFTFACVVVVAWWGWYSYRIATRMVAVAISFKKKAIHISED